MLKSGGGIDGPIEDTAPLDREDDPRR